MECNEQHVKRHDRNIGYWFLHLATTCNGRVSGSTSVSIRPCLKNGRVLTHGPVINLQIRNFLCLPRRRLSRLATLILPSTPPAIKRNQWPVYKLKLWKYTAPFSSPSVLPSLLFRFLPPSSFTPPYLFPTPPLPPLLPHLLSPSFSFLALILSPARGAGSAVSSPDRLQRSQAPSTFLTIFTPENIYEKNDLHVY